MPAAKMATPTNDSAFNEDKVLSTKATVMIKKMTGTKG